ncbi:MAG TPA: rhodanese-like domain-containing protein [Anaeromyxobacteraceae bacterium]|nr:rhodanese-like domain-containing protein [Anaeromyxobacteraceae bacterium]
MELPWWFPFGRVPEIAPADLALRLRRRPWPQLLDVRSAAEFAGGHVRGAVNVPVTELRSRIDSLRLDRSRLVVAVCLTAHRSRPAVRLLRQRGFEALQLAGGMRAWRAGRLPEASG